MDHLSLASNGLLSESTSGSTVLTHIAPQGVLLKTLIKNTASTLHVVLLDAGQLPITGVTTNDIIVYVLKEGGAPILKSVVGAWTEVGASFPGVYAIDLSAGDLDTLGTLLVSIRPDPSTVIVGMAEVIVLNVAVEAGGSSSPPILW